jgi:hypothetical protein
VLEVTDQLAIHEFADLTDPLWHYPQLHRAGGAAFFGDELNDESLDGMRPCPVSEGVAVADLGEVEVEASLDITQRHEAGACVVSAGFAEGRQHAAV